MMKQFLRRGLFLAGLLTAMAAPPIAQANNPADLASRDLTNYRISDSDWASGLVFNCYVIDTEIDNNTITCHPFMHLTYEGEYKTDEEGNYILDENGEQIPSTEDFPQYSWNNRQHLKMTGKKIKINDKWCAIYQIVINFGDKRFYDENCWYEDHRFPYSDNINPDDLYLLFVKENDKNNKWSQTPDMKLVDGGYYDLNNNGALIENIEDYEIRDFEESDNVHACCFYFYDYPKRDFDWVGENKGYPNNMWVHIWGNDGDLHPWNLSMKEGMEPCGQYVNRYSNYYNWENKVAYIPDHKTYRPILKYEFYYVGDGPTGFLIRHNNKYTGDVDNGTPNMEFVNGGAYSYNGWGNIVPVVKDPEILDQYPHQFGLTVYLIDTDAWGMNADFAFNEFYGYSGYGSEGYMASRTYDFNDKYVNLNGHWYPIYKYNINGGGKLETIQPVNRAWGERNKKTRRRGGLYEFQENGVYYFAGQDVKAPVLDINSLTIVDGADLPAAEKKPGRVYVNLGANQLMQEGLWEQPYCYLHKRLPVTYDYYSDDYLYGSYQDDYRYGYDKETGEYVTTPTTYYNDSFNLNSSMNGMMDWYDRFTSDYYADRIHEGEMTQVTLEDGTPVPGMYYYDVDDLNAYDDAVFYYYTHRYADDPNSYMVTAMHPACRSDYFNPTEWSDYIFDIGTDCVHQSYVKWEDYVSILNTPLADVKTIYLAGNEAVSGGIEHSGDDPIYSTKVDADQGPVLKNEDGTETQVTYPVFFHKIDVQTNSPAVFKISTINVPELAENLEHPEMYNFQRGWASFNLGIVGCDVKVAGEPTAPAEPVKPEEPAYETLRETNDPGEFTETEPTFDYEANGTDPGQFTLPEPVEPNPLRTEPLPPTEVEDPGTFDLTEPTAPYDEVPEQPGDYPQEPDRNQYPEVTECPEFPQPTEPAEPYMGQPEFDEPMSEPDIEDPGEFTMPEPGEDATEEERADYDTAKSMYDYNKRLYDEAWAEYNSHKAAWEVYHEWEIFFEQQRAWDGWQAWQLFYAQRDQWQEATNRWTQWESYLQQKEEYDTAYTEWNGRNDIYQTYLMEYQGYQEDHANWEAEKTHWEADMAQYESEHAAWVTAKETHEAAKAAWDEAMRQFNLAHAAWVQHYNDWFTATNRYNTDTKWNEEAAARNAEKKQNYENAMAVYNAYVIEYPGLLAAYEGKVAEWNDYKDWYNKHIVAGSPSRQVRYVTNETLGYNRYCQYPWRVETMAETPDNAHGVTEGGEYWFVIDFQKFEPEEGQAADDPSLVNETVTLLDINPHPEVTASEIKIVRIVDIPNAIAAEVMNSDSYRELRDHAQGRVLFDKLNFASGSVRVNGLDNKLLEDPHYDYEVQYTVWLNGKELQQKFDDRPSHIRVNYMALRDKDDIAVRARYHDKSTGRYFSTMFSKGNVEIPSIAADLAVEEITHSLVQISDPISTVAEDGDDTPMAHRLGCAMNIKLDATPRDNVACFADVCINEFVVNEIDKTDNANIELLHSDHRIISDNLWNSYLGDSYEEVNWEPYFEDEFDGYQWNHNWADMIVRERKIPAFIDNVVTDYNPAIHERTEIQANIGVRTIYPFIIRVEEKNLVIDMENENDENGNNETDENGNNETPAESPRRAGLSSLTDFDWENAVGDVKYEETDLPKTPEEFAEAFEMQKIGEVEEQPLEFIDEEKTLSAIENVSMDALEENLPIEVYTISGIRVSSDNLAPGVYIVRQGQKVRKIYVH